MSIVGCPVVVVLGVNVPSPPLWLSLEGWELVGRHIVVAFSRGAKGTKYSTMVRPSKIAIYFFSDWLSLFVSVYSYVLI